MDVKSDLSHDDAQKNFNPIGVNGLHMAGTSIWALNPKVPSPSAIYFGSWKCTMEYLQYMTIKFFPSTCIAVVQYNYKKN
jgi:hypothetical protein